MLFDAFPQAKEDRCCWRTVEGTVISMLPSEDEPIETSNRGKVWESYAFLPESWKVMEVLRLCADCAGRDWHQLVLDHFGQGSCLRM